MKCTHEVYSRYLGCETDSDGVEWCIIGCRECDATMKFPAQAKMARKYAAIRADYESGMSATKITKKYGYASRGAVINLLHQLDTRMRPRGGQFYKGKKHTPAARRRMSEAKRRYWQQKNNRSARGEAAQ